MRCLRFSNRSSPRISLNEIRDALGIIEKLEKSSLTLYDRLFFHETLAKAHRKAGNFYLARCKKNATKEIAAFHLLYPWRKKKAVQIGDETVHLIKIWNSSTQEWDIYATNLPGSWQKPKLIFKLYRLRWAVETSFFELTAIAKVEQWHSKFINGILQELFTLLWLSVRQSGESLSPGAIPVKSGAQQAPILTTKPFGSYDPLRQSNTSGTPVCRSPNVGLTSHRCLKRNRPKNGGLGAFPALFWGDSHPTDGLLSAFAETGEKSHG